MRNKKTNKKEKLVVVTAKVPVRIAKKIDSAVTKSLFKFRSDWLIELILKELG